MAVKNRLLRMREIAGSFWSYLHPERRLDDAWRRHEEVQRRIDSIRLGKEREGYE